MKTTLMTGTVYEQGGQIRLTPDGIAGSLYIRQRRWCNDFRVKATGDCIAFARRCYGTEHDTNPLNRPLWYLPSLEAVIAPIAKGEP